MTYKGTVINDLVATVEEKQPLMGVGFNMRPSDYDKLRGAAKDLNTSVSAVCRVAVNNFVRELEVEDDMERDRR